jgi:cytochrome c biogenesis protein CcmG/thiol:disulfide interchange protein DsbE
MSAEPRAVNEGSARRPSRSLVTILPRAVGVAVVVSLLGLLIWDVSHSGRGASFTEKIRQGKKPPAPAFALPVLWDHRETWPSALHRKLDDGRVALRDLRGYPVVVNFWASWCVPCRKEAPAFDVASRRYAGRVVFLGLDIQDFRVAARRFLRRYQVHYVSLRDGSGSTYAAYGLTGVPETYFLDRQGRAIEHAVGGVSARELEQGIRLLLEKSG